jgi:hypothetical protein
MPEPVIPSDGHTYEKKAIQKVFLKKKYKLKKGKKIKDPISTTLSFSL